MQITRTSQMSGKTNTLELDVTAEQIATWKSGVLIQNAFPNLNADEREFIKSGITPTEWEEMFGEDEDERDQQNYLHPSRKV